MSTAFVKQTRKWFDHNARDLPWRAADRTPWQVLVSEFMLQQTPVVRVLPVYQQWIARWPTAAALAAEPVSEAIRHWGRLGYPRRAMRLHELARTVDRDFDGQIPADEVALRSLPGVGEYTAAAVMAFAFGRRSLVLDTNIRRVLARVLNGHQWPAVAITSAERELASALMPRADADCAHWNAAVMELGALVCTASQPRCAECPLAAICAWNRAGRPQQPRPHRTQSWHGTDRQCRGRLLQVLRERETASSADFERVWPDSEQRQRCIDALMAEGFMAKRGRAYRLADS